MKLTLLCGWETEAHNLETQVFSLGGYWFPIAQSWDTLDPTGIASAAKETNLFLYTLLMLYHSIPHLSESNYVGSFTILLKQSQDFTLFLKHKTLSPA